MDYCKKQSGFTLIELLVTVVIVGILAVASHAVYTNSRMKSRDAVRQMHVLAMKSAVEQLYVMSGQYPKPLELKASLVDFGTMKTFPTDPNQGTADDTSRFEYVYGAATNETYLPGQEYEISANLEYGTSTSEKPLESVDKGNDQERWEIGSDVDLVNTDLPENGDECESQNDYAPNDIGSGNCVVIEDL